MRADFKEAITTGRRVFFTPHSLDEIKAHFVACLQQRLLRYRSQSEAAEVWEVPQSSVSNIATGKVDRLSTQAIIAIALREEIVRGISVKV